MLGEGWETWGELRAVYEVGIRECLQAWGGRSLWLGWSGSPSSGRLWRSSFVRCEIPTSHTSLLSLLGPARPARPACPARLGLARPCSACSALLSLLDRVDFPTTILRARFGILRTRRGTARPMQQHPYSHTGVLASRLNPARIALGLLHQHNGDAMSGINHPWFVSVKPMLTPCIHPT